MEESKLTVQEKLLKLEIVTPQKSVFSGFVQSFSAPGTSGGFQILHDHAPFLTTIAVGEVKVEDAKGSEWLYSTSGGFVEVSDNEITFLAETAERKDEIDIERAKEAMARAEERIREKKEETDIARARAALARAMNRLRITETL